MDLYRSIYILSPNFSFDRQLQNSCLGLLFRLQLKSKTDHPEIDFQEKYIAHSSQ